MKACLMAHQKIIPVLNIKFNSNNDLSRAISNIGASQHKNNAEWAAPTFMISKINGIVYFTSDFRELNQRIKGKSFPIPKI